MAIRRAQRLGQVGLLAVLAFCFRLGIAGQAPLHVPGGAEVQKGAHLARIADCMGCHTYKEDEPYAGGQPMKSPFGTFYTSNLTQDKQTGLGDWSYEDFKNALHHGRRKDGNFIYPAMPFESYTKIRDSDVRALWAYFQQIKPVHNKIPDPELVVVKDYFSSLTRLAVFGWQIPFFDAKRFEPDPNRSAEYNKGAYYVHALGHCSSCHTPRNIAFAQEKDEFLNGFTLNGWYAPRISPGPNSSIKDWSVDDLTTYLKEGELGKQSMAVGPMHEVWYDSLRHVPREDLHAIAVYIKNMPVRNGQRVAQRDPIEPEQAALGQQVYAQHCATCHQNNGQGRHGVAPALAGNSLATADKPNSVIMSVLIGFDPKNTWGAMPSFAEELSDKEVTAVTNYVRTAWQNNGSANATATMVANSRPMAADKIPPGGQRQAVICPSLPSDVIRPALKPSEKQRLAAYTDENALKQMISTYESARPDAPSSDTIKALTASYCRALVKQENTTDSKRNDRIYQFSQRVADRIGL